MKKFSENRFLADLYSKDAVQAVFLQELIDRIDNVAKQSGVAMAGDLAAPPPINAINVKASGEMVHVTLTHAAELTRPIEYYVEADTNPGFTAPPVIRHMGPSRSDIIHLPGFNDSGVQQKWYLRAYAQYPGSKPSQPLVFGGLANPTAITLTGGAGGTKLTPLGSTGSGTASTTGQQGGSGRGKFRLSTPKVIRVGKQQAAVQPTQTTVQPGGQPVIVFTPQPNGNTPPVVVVDQSGNGGIDFGGGTPIFGRLSANSVAFADTSGNLLLKNVSTVNGITTGPSTTSTTYAVIPEMTQTLTFHGNKIILVFSTSLNLQSVTGTNQLVALAFFKDGVQLSQEYQITAGFTGASTVVTNWEFLIPLTYLDTPSAASHTYDVRWRLTNTGPTLFQLGTNRTFQIVELG